MISQGCQDVSPEGASQCIVRPAVELMAGRVLVCAHVGIPHIRNQSAQPFLEASQPEKPTGFEGYCR